MTRDEYGQTENANRGRRTEWTPPTDWTRSSKWMRVRVSVAIHQIQLAAPAVGLGTTFTGSINTASQAYPPLVNVLGIPEGNTAYGTFVIGYPAEKYHRIPARRPVDVTWR